MKTFGRCPICQSEMSFAITDFIQLYGRPTMLCNSHSDHCIKYNWNEDDITMLCLEDDELMSSKQIIWSLWQCGEPSLSIMVRNDDWSYTQNYLPYFEPDFCGDYERIRNRLKLMVVFQ